jgi:hypothetical protein
VSIQPESPKASVLANGRLTLTQNAEAYFETSYTNNKITASNRMCRPGRS